MLLEALSFGPPIFVVAYLLLLTASCLVTDDPDDLASPAIDSSPRLIWRTWAHAVSAHDLAATADLPAAQVQVPNHSVDP